MKHVILVGIALLAMPSVAHATDMDTIDALANIEAAAVVCSTVYPADYKLYPKSVADAVVPIIVRVAATIGVSTDELIDFIQAKASARVDVWSALATTSDLHSVCNTIVDSGALGLGLRRPVS